MIENFRHFRVGPDPFGRNYEVQFMWLQTGISIRHADTVDVKWKIVAGGNSTVKVVALKHPDLLQLSSKLGRALTDPWCMKLAALHLRRMILTGEDMEKTLVTASAGELAEYQQELQQKQPA